MDELKDDFLEHIKQTLRNQELEYQNGAWERFAQKGLTAPPKKGRTFPLWKWGTAVAAVLIGIIAVTQLLHSPTSKENPSQTKLTKITPPDTQSLATTPLFNDSGAQNLNANIPNSKINTSHEIIKHFKTTQTSVPFVPNHQKTPTAINTTPSLPEEWVVRKPEPLAPSTGIVQDQEKPEKPNHHFWEPQIIAVAPTKNPPAQQATLAQSGNESNRVHPTKADYHEKKWQSSIFLSPIFGESGVDMGYGYAIGYAITDKIKISTGIAHSKISTSRNYDIASGPQTAASSSIMSLEGTESTLKSSMASAYAPHAAISIPQLESVFASVSGLDIPVDINYKISNKFYASAGVSGLLVMKDKATFNYVSNSNVQVRVENNGGILKEDKSIQLTQHATSSAPPPGQPREETGILGFYNISMGFKQKITPKNNVAIEPFIKIPMKSVSQQQLNYTGAGLRLKFDF